MIYLLNTTKNGRRNSTLKVIEEVHNCPTVRDVSSLAYKETKNKQKKMVELANKLCFVETFLFLLHFLFLLFSSVPLFYASANALHKISRPCGKLPCVVI